MKPIHLNKSAFLSNIPYLIKCLLGVIICYALYKGIPQYPFYWAMVSVVIVLSPDNSDSLAYDRMKANVLGCAVGICLYSLHLPDLILLCIGIAITICIGIALRVTNSLRSALAALVIITIDVEQGKHWYIALERMFCVVAGCLVALMITMLFNVATKKLGKKKVGVVGKGHKG